MYHVAPHRPTSYRSTIAAKVLSWFAECAAFDCWIASSVTYCRFSGVFRRLFTGRGWFTQNTGC